MPRSGIGLISAPYSVKASTDDPVAGFLDDNITAASGITLNVVDNNGDKVLQIGATGGGGGGTTLYAHEVELETVTGSETSIATGQVPYSENSLRLNRNGVLMRRVLTTPSGIVEYYHNAGLARVEFNAAGEESWYILQFLYE
jgi:hypothetical protein